jgi:predicted O-linked N-acetylglucosamine transferase (SPINDLY family)
VSEAIECHRQVVRLRPASAAAGSDLLLTLHYDPAFDRRRLRDEAVRWAEKHAEPLTRLAAPHGNDAGGDRPLRIGYVSADFREHPVARLMEPVLANLDRSAFHAVCYSDVRRPDEVTGSLASGSRHLARDGGAQ